MDAKDIVNTALQYQVSLTNQGPSSDFEFSFDIYPANNPYHPVRHYGHWNKKFSLKHGETLPLRVDWDPYQKDVRIDGAPADLAWSGTFFELGDYRVNFIVYCNGAQVAQKTEILAISDQPDFKTERVIHLDIREESQLKSAVWFITYACDFRCPYCWEAQRQKNGEFKPDPFIPYERWTSAWNKLRPSILDITGGEPFLQPNFVDMLEQFDDHIKVAITTNISYDLTSFVQKITPEKVVSMTISLHPTQRMSFSVFMGKCLMLKNRGFNLTINYVTYPEQMWMIPEYKETCEKYGLRFHVDPYSPTPYFPYNFSEREREFLKPYVGNDRSRFFEQVEQYPVLCSGGFNHLDVQPNGDAFRCINDKINNYAPVGNILDPNFELYSEWKRCDDYYRCPNCDRDKIKVQRIEG